MISRGFFSVFVTAFAVIFIISLFYAQSVQYDTQFHSAELGVVNQSLTKDWFMVRNALENFTSDAILRDIETQPTPPSSGAGCNPNFAALDYNNSVEAYWDRAVMFMNKTYGTQCDVNLSVAVQNRLEIINLTYPSVRDEQRAYGILACTRSSLTSTLTISRPFVIHKDVVVTSFPTHCDVNVFDVLGDNPATGVRYSKLDVSKSYP